MPLVAYALVSLANTKTFLGITDNTKDALLEMLINMATDYIQSQCNVNYFMATDYVIQELDGTGTDQLVLPNHPAWDLTSLQERTGSGITDWRTIPSDEYTLDGDNGIITWTSQFTGFDEGLNDENALSDPIFQKVKRKYRATYTAGYNTIPYDLQYACMSLVGQMLNTKSASGIVSESLGDHSITYSDAIKASKDGIIEDIITRYRNIPLAD